MLSYRPKESPDGAGRATAREHFFYFFFATIGLVDSSWRQSVGLCWFFVHYDTLLFVKTSENDIFPSDLKQI